MSMKTHKIKNRNKSKRNIKRAALIKFYLAQRGFTQAQIAKDLNISRAAVHRAVYSLTTVSRVDEWLEKNIGRAV